ncbi:DUF421 domain-containing protein [Lutibacter sp. B2]|nr:DUF421 domain-containing protein [Lutibacter sp. B2]
MDLHTVFFKGEELSILGLFIRSSILYFMLFGSGKLMGFRQPGIITPYNFLMAAGISHIAAARMVNPQSRLVDAMVIIIIYTFIHLLISYLYLKFPFIISQESRILVKKGKIIKENLKKSRLTIDNLFSILRQKDAFNLANVDYVIAESVGDFSVGINTNHLSIAKINMGINEPLSKLSEILIYEGKVDKNVLHKNNLHLDWVYQQLSKYNISDIKDVYVAIITPDGTLYMNK